MELPTEQSRRFRLNSVQADEPPPPQLATVTQPPPNPDFELRFLTEGAAPNSIRMPKQGSLKVTVEEGSSFSVTDADGTDGEARIQVPAGTLDFYLRPEKLEPPPMCKPASSLTGNALLAYMDQLVLDKANQLISQGKSQCVYLPPANQRQNGNCNSTSQGLQCNGALNKTIQASQCPEIAVYAGNLNINQAISSKMFAAIQNNLTINNSATGIFSSQGNLNTNLNATQTLEGVFVGNRANNLNVKGNSKFKGLFTSLDSGSMPFNLHDSSSFEGAFCSQGNVNGSRKSSAQLIYKPDILNSWAADLPLLPGMACAARSNFYTQTLPLTCPPPTSNESLQVTDTLYGLSQSLSPSENEQWYHAAKRPVPVPEDWQSQDDSQYVLRFENHGVASLTSLWYSQNTSAQVPASVKVIPAIDCVKANPQGSYTAYLSYTNLLAKAVTLPVDESNQLTPAGTAQTQPTRFESGQSVIFPNSTVTVNFSGPELKWTVGARSVSAQATDPALQCPEVHHSPELLISDVHLTETGVGIMGKDAPGGIEPDFAGQDIGLTLTGTFKDEQKQPIPLHDFLFTLAPPLIQQTFVGTEPIARVLLDDSILLDVISVSDSEIKAILHTEGIPDLYLKGLHRLSVEQGEWFTDTLIQVGEPLPPLNSLIPSIDSIEVLRDSGNRPLHLRLKGQNFMVYPKFSYTIIDGEFGFGYQTEVISDGHSETIVHVPQPDTFDQKSNHLVIMATPFGVAYREF